MLTIRDLRKTVGGRTLFEQAVHAGELRRAGRPRRPERRGQVHLVLAHPQARRPGRGHHRARRLDHDRFPAPGKRTGGRETVMDIATGRVGELPTLEKRLRELEEAGNVEGRNTSKPRQARRPEQPPDRGQGQEDAARTRLPRDGFRPAGPRDERRLDHARAPRPPVGHGAGPAPARRADQPPRPACPCSGCKTTSKRTPAPC